MALDGFRGGLLISPKAMPGMYTHTSGADNTYPDTNPIDCMKAM